MMAASEGHSTQNADPAGGGRRFWAKPSTSFGWWAVRLTTAFMVLVVLNVIIFLPATEMKPWHEVFLPIYSITALSAGLVGAALGLIALIHRGERSLMVWLTLPTGLLIIGFLLGELLGQEH